MPAVSAVPFSVTLVIVSGGVNVSVSDTLSVAVVAVAPRFCSVKVYVSTPASVTVVGHMDLITLKSGAGSAFTVASAVRGAASPPPVTVAVFVTLSSAP